MPLWWDWKRRALSLEMFKVYSFEEETWSPRNSPSSTNIFLSQFMYLCKPIVLWEGKFQLGKFKNICVCGGMETGFSVFANVIPTITVLIKFLNYKKFYTVITWSLGNNGSSKIDTLRFKTWKLHAVRLTPITIYL